MFVLGRHVSTQCVDYETCSCACSHTKRQVPVHFLMYEDNLRNMVVEIKHRILCDKLHSDTSSYVKIYTR